MPIRIIHQADPIAIGAIEALGRGYEARERRKAVSAQAKAMRRKYRGDAINYSLEALRPLSDSIQEEGRRSRDIADAQSLYESKEKARQDREIAVQREKARLEYVKGIHDLTEPHFSEKQEAELSGLFNELQELDAQFESGQAAYTEDDYLQMRQDIEDHIASVKPERRFRKKEMTAKDAWASGQLDWIKDPTTGENIGIANFVDPQKPTFEWGMFGGKGGKGKEDASGPWAAYPGAEKKSWDDAHTAALEELMGTQTEGPAGEDGAPTTENKYQNPSDIPPEEVARVRDKLLRQKFPQAGEQPAAAPAAAPVTPTAPAGPEVADRLAGKPEEVVARAGALTRSISTGTQFIAETMSNAGQSPYLWKAENLAETAPIAGKLIDEILERAKLMGLEGKISDADAATLAACSEIIKAALYAGVSLEAEE